MTGTKSPVAAPASSNELAGAARREQSRARYPDEEGYVERDGVRIFWERYGDGEPTVLLLPTWSVVHSRFWKMQIPYLARHCRVVTFDGRGNGRSDRPSGAEANSTDEFAADAVAVMDATGTERATLVALSCGALWGTIVAANHPERVDGIVYIGPAVRLAPGHPERDVPFDEPLDTDEGWAKYNSFYWKRDYRDFLEFFFAKCFNEPHSTQADRGLDRLGARDDARDAGGHDPRDRLSTRRGLRRDVRAGHMPGARHPRRLRPGPAPAARRGARRGDRRHVRHARRCRPHPERARPGQAEPAAPRFHRPAAAGAPLDARPRHERDARSTSPRRSASATRVATSRSPAS